tara:strand:- start:17788 stop:18321 length:534 start_codon:yes stop_codon:yes gene_type:complete
MKEIQVITGCMFAGKTTELINRLKSTNKKYLLVKPALDTRDMENKICTHDGVFETGIQVNRLLDISKHLDDISVLGVDEAQFFDSPIIEDIREISSKGISIILAGLAKDYLNKPFGYMSKIIEMSNSVTWLKAKCHQCGLEATYSHRKQRESESQVVIGDAEKYEALCETCFKKYVK